MNTRPTYPQEIDNIVEAVLNSPAETSSELRHSLEAYTAALSGGQREPASLPTDLEGYIKKLSERPHELTDEDMDALTAASYSDDTIFEITISAALGSSLARLEKGLELVRGLSA